MSPAVARLRNIVSSGEFARLLLVFAFAALLFSTLLQFASGFVCIGYSCPGTLLLPGEPAFGWPDVHSIFGGLLQSAVRLGAIVFPLTLIGAVFAVQSVWLWLAPWFAATALAIALTISSDLGSLGGQSVRVWIAFGAGSLAFLAPLMTYHFLAWRNAARTLR